MTQPKEIWVDYYSILQLESYEITDFAEVGTFKHAIDSIKYLSEEHFNSTIEKWKEEEKIWIKQLEEKDKEILRLKEQLDKSYAYEDKGKPDLIERIESFNKEIEILKRYKKNE